MGSNKLAVIEGEDHFRFPTVRRNSNVRGGGRLLGLPRRLAFRLGQGLFRKIGQRRFLRLR